MEILNEIKGFPNYFITESGLVFSKANVKLRPRKTKPNKLGYIRFNVFVDGKRKSLLVHRLLCELFNGPAPKDKPLALHNDGNPRNNSKENLRWGSHLDNSKDKEKHGTHKMVCPVRAAYGCYDKNKKGYHYNRTLKKYVVMIKHLGLAIRIGAYSDPKIARREYVFYKGKILKDLKEILRHDKEVL